jgi:hypothetical protein
MKGPVLVLLGIALGCAAGAAGLVSKTSLGQRASGGPAVDQYCEATGEYNHIGALNEVVRRAGAQGWELVTIARPAPLGATHSDWACFRRAR